jgi:cytochrome c oxidase subunit 3
MRDHEVILSDQFEDFEQQETAATTGMWVFLATEILFFGGLFLAYLVLRTTYPHQFAVGSGLANVTLGTLNTAILLTSSFTMVLAVQSAESGASKSLVLLLLGTIAFGLVFLALKGLEYREHFQDHLFPGIQFRKDLPKQVELFYWLYFVMTGLHALHVLIGIGLLSVMAILAMRGKFSPGYHTPIKIAGLYWHFVDIVWVILYPLFYLIHK